MDENELAKLFAQFNVPDHQIRRLVDAFKYGGRKLYEYRIRELLSRGLLPPKVGSVLLGIPNSSLPAILVRAIRLADYLFVKPLVDHWDDFSKQLKKIGININHDDIAKVIVNRSKSSVIIEMHLKKRIYIDRKNLERLYEKFLREKENGLSISIIIRVKYYGSS